MKKIFLNLLYVFGLKKFVIENTKLIIQYYKYQINNFFNKEVINQNKDYKSIPIIIISFNQLLYLRKLIDFLQKNNYKNIVIIDNNSTYQPLLDYFKTIEGTVTIHRLKENLGHLVFWKNKELYNKYSKGYYVVTDADIVPDENCPDDFILYFKKILDKNFSVIKVGFSLFINDLPNSNINKQKVIKWEQKFWKNKLADNNYIADIDTTFALYRPDNLKYTNSNFFKAIRTKDPYFARHGGWYIDNKNLTEEQLFYFSNCSKSSSWKTDLNGKLITEIYG